MSTQSIFRLPQVITRTGKSRSCIYADVRDCLFPAPVKIGRRSVGWPSNEIEALLAARIAGKTDDEIRAVVEKLEAARKTAGL